MTKLCINCKHSEKVLTYHCKHPINGIDLIDGTISTRFCLNARSNSMLGSCGPDGRYYEARPYQEPKPPEPSSLCKLVNFLTRAKPQKS